MSSLWCVSRPADCCQSSNQQHPHLSCKHIQPMTQAFCRQGEARRAAGRWPYSGNVRLKEPTALTEEEMRKRLAGLKIEHRDLDAAIDALTAAGSKDQMQIAGLKKRKLQLKDQIMMLEDYLVPDIIA